MAPLTTTARSDHDRMAPLFLTIKQASIRLGGVPSAESLYRLARDGHLPVKRIGRKLVISTAQLEAWANTPGDARGVSYAGTARGGQS
jgi:excisionase family DNA binding protein